MTLYKKGCVCLQTPIKHIILGILNNISILHYSNISNKLPTQTHIERTNNTNVFLKGLGLPSLASQIYKHRQKQHHNNFTSGKQVISYLFAEVIRHHCNRMKSYTTRINADFPHLNSYLKVSVFHLPTYRH